MYAAKADLGHDVCGHTWLPPALHLLAPMSERLWRHNQYTYAARRCFSRPRYSCLELRLSEENMLQLRLCELLFNS